MIHQYTTTPDTLLSEAFAQNINHALAVLEDGKVVGVLLMRDVLTAYVQLDQVSDLKVSDCMMEDIISVKSTNNILQMAYKFANHKVKSLVVSEDSQFLDYIDAQEVIALLPDSLLGFFQPANQNMIVNPYTITPNTEISEAIAMLARYRISCLPVVDAAGKPLGMFSESDAVRCVFLGACVGTVSRVMTTPALTCPSQTNLRQCWDLMAETKVMKLLMVREDGRLHGLLTVTDVLVGLCRSLLSVFQAYHCSKDVDMMLEWRTNGMIMAVSERMNARLDASSEALTGLRWQDGCNDKDIEAMFNLHQGEQHAFTWSFSGVTLAFIARRDADPSPMFWVLDTP